jgi:8-oxo-dGTP diphosphatase
MNCMDEVFGKDKIREETGIAAEPGRIAFVLESHSPESGVHTLDLVFLAALSGPGQEPRSAERDLTASFVPLSSLHQLDLRPPLAGYLRGLSTRQPGQTAAYLGNLWRPHRHDEPENVLFEFAEPPPMATLPEPGGPDT